MYLAPQGVLLVQLYVLSVERLCFGMLRGPVLIGVLSRLGERFSLPKGVVAPKVAESALTTPTTLAPKV